MGLPCTSPNSEARGKTGLTCPPKAVKGSALRFGPWPVRSWGQGPSYHKRFCSAKFRVIYASKEEPVEVNLSTGQRLKTGPHSQRPGGTVQPGGPLGVWQGPHSECRCHLHLLSAGRRGEWDSWYPARQFPRAYSWAGPGQIV